MILNIYDLVSLDMLNDDKDKFNLYKHSKEHLFSLFIQLIDYALVQDISAVIKHKFSITSIIKL